MVLAFRTHDSILINWYNENLKMATDVSLLSLFAADKGQIEESRRRTFQQWGKASNLSSEQYQLREEFLAAQEMAKDGKLIVW
jgi:hypothetical protein